MTDGYIVGTFLDEMNMEDINATPQPVPLFSLMNDVEKADWLYKAAERVMKALQLTNITSLENLISDMSALDNDESNLNAMKVEDGYLCAVCGQKYLKSGWLRKHLEKKHHWQFHTTASSSSTSHNPVQCFLFMSLLYRDTCDSYRMGDGERIVRNAYFEWIYASALKHTKYRIWLFRMITYVISILSPEKSFEYKWNMTVNLKGGTGKNIPNDNCVEIQVHNIKSQLNCQGSNKSFESARKICMTTQVVDAIKEQLISTTRTVRSKNNRPAVDKSKDIDAIANCIRSKGCVKDMHWPSFSNFKDPLSVVNACDLHSWVNQQKNVANLYMK